MLTAKNIFGKKMPGKYAVHTLIAEIIKNSNGGKHQIRKITPTNFRLNLSKINLKKYIFKHYKRILTFIHFSSIFT